MRVRVIVNPGGGTAKGIAPDALAQEIEAAFAAHGVEADICMAAPADLPDAFADAASAPGLDAVIASGGDGTVSSAAAALTGGDRPLGILPLGTLNHFARDAGIPTDLAEAAAVIAAGKTRRVDVAEVNGRVFVNNSSVGIYSDFVRSRDAQQHRFRRSKRLAMAVASVRALRHFGRRQLTIRVPEGEVPIVTPLLFVGNNRYEVTRLRLGRREAIDRGELCLYAVLAPSPMRFLGLGLRALLGLLRKQDFVSLTGIKEAEINSAHSSIDVAADGETWAGDTPLRYRIRPGDLLLLAP